MLSIQDTIYGSEEKKSFSFKGNGSKEEIENNLLSFLSKSDKNRIKKNLKEIIEKDLSLGSLYDDFIKEKKSLKEKDPRIILVLFLKYFM